MLKRPHSLTVAGAVQAFHLIPVSSLARELRAGHLAASRYHSPVRPALLFALLFCVNSFAAPVAVRDDYAHEVALAAPAARVVSLSPHLTELLYAAGAGSRVVGAVAFSDYPKEARDLPRVGSDAAINLEAVLALRPDLVVAWPNAGSVRAVNRLAGLQMPVFRSEPRELEDIARTLERLGVLLGTTPQANAAAQAFRARAKAIEARYGARRAVRVFYQVWDRPLLTVNGEHVISKVIRLCGGENVFAGLPWLAPEIDREAVLHADPEAIVASGAGGARPAWLDDWKAFPGLAAGAKGHLYAIAPELLQRHTPRLLDGAEQLCRMLETVRDARS
jgi:iron complex transport system substrate-binding protein